MISQRIHKHFTRHSKTCHHNVDLRLLITRKAALSDTFSLFLFLGLSGTKKLKETFSSTVRVDETCRFSLGGLTSTEESSESPNCDKGWLSGGNTFT